jgi:putative heme-binding domain-containing protein
VHNIVHRDVLAADGPTFTARRAQEGKEFLASTDSWFRPVFTTVGPDGALYIVDYHRQVVEHPEYAPEEIVDQIPYKPDVNCGRIYRVVHESAAPARKLNLAAAASQELVEELANPNLWWRITSQRLLVDRQDRSVIPALEALARDPKSDFGRLHALHTLEGLGALDAALVEAALEDPHPTVREHAIRLAESLSDRGLLDRRRFEKALFRLVEDSNARVQLQAACSLGGFGDDEAFAKLREVALRHIESPWFQTAVLSSSPERSAVWFSFLVRQPEALGEQSPAKEDFFRLVTGMIGARRKDSEIAAVLGAVPQGRDSGGTWWRWSALNGLAQGLARGGPQPKLPASQRILTALLGSADAALRTAALEVALGLKPEDTPALRNLVRRASQTARDENETLANRVLAVRMLGFDPASKPGELAGELLSPHQPEALQVAAVEALARLEGARASQKLLPKWLQFTGVVREAATAALFRYPESLAALLDAVESEQIQPWGINENRRRLLLRHPDPAIQQRARTLFASLDTDRKAVYERYRPALGLQGDAGRGRQVFHRVCAECHKVADMGSAVGPDILSVVIRNKEVLMTDILDPNRRIEAGFEEYLVETADGRTVTGVIGAESADSITLRRAKGEQDVVPRAQIRTLRSLTVSAMPGDLENQIDVGQMADLLAYLKSL